MCNSNYLRRIFQPFHLSQPGAARGKVEMAHQAQPARTTWCDPGNAALPQDNCKGHAVRRQSRRPVIALIAFGYGNYSREVLARRCRVKDSLPICEGTLTKARPGHFTLWNMPNYSIQCSRAIT
jgi:hypothetical protein